MCDIVKMAMTEQEGQNLLSRLDERTNFNTELHKANSELIKSVADKLDAYMKHVSDRYVTKEEFLPVKSIVYGLVGVILTAFIGSIIILVFR